MAVDARRLASEILAARDGAWPVPEDERPAELDRASAEEVARVLQAELAGRGLRQVGWKLGATSAAVQARFGTDRPFAWPLHDRTTLPDGAVVSRATLVAPLLEPELGFRVEGGVARPCAAIELVDARLRPDWRVTLADAVADLGMHAAALFGEAGEAAGGLPVEVRLDGELRWAGTGDVAGARAALRWLPDGWEAACGGAALVATGTLCDPLPLEPGRWEVSFGPLGTLSVFVTP